MRARAIGERNGPEYRTGRSASSAPGLDVAGEEFESKLASEPFPRRGYKCIPVKVADNQGRTPAHLQEGERKHLLARSGPWRKHRKR